MLYSFEGFPFLKSSQSTLPPLGLHSWPSVSSNSVEVSPGGNLLIMIFNLGVAALGSEFSGTVAGLFWVADAGIDNIPFARGVAMIVRSLVLNK